MVSPQRFDERPSPSGGLDEPPPPTTEPELWPPPPPPTPPRLTPPPPSLGAISPKDDSDIPGWVTMVGGFVIYTAASIAVAFGPWQALRLVALLLLLLGLSTASVQTTDYLNEIRHWSHGSAPLVGFLFFLLTACTPLGLVLWPNAHRVADKYGL